MEKSRNFLNYKRPLTEEMIAYAANDVLYLPKLYNIFSKNCEENKNSNLSIRSISSLCEKYLDYCNINLSIKNYNKVSIEAGKIVEGLLK